MIHNFAVGLVSDQCRYDYYCGDRVGVNNMIDDYLLANPDTGYCGIYYYPQNMINEMILRVNEINSDNPKIKCNLILV
jgi:hypothetical protein